MTTAADTRRERINLRLKVSAKKALERAASLEGRTVSQFVLTSALSQAEKTIHEHTVMRSNAQDAVVDAIDQGHSAFYEQFGFSLLSGERRRLFLPPRSVQAGRSSGNIDFGRRLFWAVWSPPGP